MCISFGGLTGTGEGFIATIIAMFLVSFLIKKLYFSDSSRKKSENLKIEHNEEVGSVSSSMRPK